MIPRPPDNERHTWLGECATVAGFLDSNQVREANLKSSPASGEMTLTLVVRTINYPGRPALEHKPGWGGDPPIVLPKSRRLPYLEGARMSPSDDLPGWGGDVTINVSLGLANRLSHRVVRSCEEERTSQEGNLARLGKGV